jgi:uncharacterized protein
VPAIDLPIAAAGLVAGLAVGMTGMGGGALMTPLLVLVFRVQPLAAISSDLVASLVMKPFGTAVHARRHTIDFGLVKWLTLTAVPFAFAGVLVDRWLGSGQVLEDRLKVALGIALLLAACGIVAQTVLVYRRRPGASTAGTDVPVTVRRGSTLAIGAMGGLIVGMTSVGAGSLILAALMGLYPRLSSRRLVGTNLAQAVPLVGAAALGHMLYGDFKLAITLSILVGAIPGVLLGAQLSSRAPDLVVRPILLIVLMASALALVNGQVNLWLVGAIEVALLVPAAIAYFWVARRRPAEMSDEVAV